MKTVDERRRILTDLEDVEPLLRTTSTTEIVTTSPVPVVADGLEAGGGRLFAGVGPGSRDVYLVYVAR